MILLDSRQDLPAQAGGGEMDLDVPAEVLEPKEEISAPVETKAEKVEKKEKKVEDKPAEESEDIPF